MGLTAPGEPGPQKAPKEGMERRNRRISRHQSKRGKGSGKQMLASPIVLAASFHRSQHDEERLDSKSEKGTKRELKLQSGSYDVMRQSTVLADLRAKIARIEGVCARHDVIPFGVEAIDSRLPGGGLVTGALHEVAGSPELADDASATIFLAGIFARTEGPVFWCLRWRDLFAPALHLAGLRPDRLIHVEAGSDTNVLLAMEESLRHPGLAGVVGEVAKYTTTASKRLQLAAETSGVPAFLFRRASKLGPAVEGSAALTRWRITASPSEDLGIPSLGRPRWRVDLERVRGGNPHQWILEGCDATGRIALPAALVDRPAAQEDRQAAA